MKRRVFAWMAVGVVVVVVLGGRVWGDPRQREARRVEKRILALAEAVSFTDKDSPLLKLGYADKVGGFFAPTTDLDIILGNREAHATLSKAELTERAGAMRVAARGLSVQFLDAAVTLNEAMDQATVHLTSKIYFTGDADYWVQEFRLQLEKHAQQGWQVSRIATIRTME